MGHSNEYCKRKGNGKAAGKQNQPANLQNLHQQANDGNGAKEQLGTYPNDEQNRGILEYSGLQQGESSAMNQLHQGHNSGPNMGQNGHPSVQQNNDAGGQFSSLIQAQKLQLLLE